MAVRYMAGFPFRLKIKNTMSIRNTKNSRIVKINPSIYIPSRIRFLPPTSGMQQKKSFFPLPFSMIQET
jgi:hypothetical protein